MKTYLVGGAVRDRLLGKPVQDRDWVVVGATPEQMLARGFKQVGADFPVFLHPESHEEYALARTERKQGHGYHGFTVYSAPDVTLEEDLRRRDLTINAMAEAEDGTLIDPYGGQRDLDTRTIRHVSSAFTEDPLRILRLARFAARLAPLGFKVAEETEALMTAMVRSGEADHLVPERIWQETCRALHEQCPPRYFEILRECGALKVVMPELDSLFGQAANSTNSPVNQGELALQALARASATSAETPVRFASLTATLGKPPGDAASSAEDARNGQSSALASLCERLKVPNDCRELAALASAACPRVFVAPDLDAEALLGLLDRCDAWRRPQRFQQLLQVCEACSLTSGSPGSPSQEPAFPQADILRQALEAAQGIQAKAYLDQGITGRALGEAMREGRLERIRDIRRV